MVMFGKVGIEKVSSKVVMDSDVSKSKNIFLGYPHLKKEKGSYTIIAGASECGLISIDSSDLNRLKLMTSDKDLEV